MYWSKQKVLVSGGASFIGSHPVDALVERSASVRVVDNLSSGQLENIQGHINNCHVEFFQKDFLKPEVAQQVGEAMDVVFHLTADHGSRGYVDLQHAACATQDD